MVKMRQRADIDGLRAVAVLPVVAYHAHMVGAPGGFVGVDVFFVISGYLISAILLREMEAGEFSITRFYERRIRRILPALFVVMAACAVAAAAVLMPQDLEEFGRSCIATALFLSNIFFWNETDYFDSAADMKPLLHTWSLAVEEQFYILFPILMLICLRLAKRKVLVLQIAVTVVFAASLALSVWAVAHVPVAAFYWAPTRVWELMCGSVLALGMVPKPKSPALCEALGWLGLAGIVGSYVFLADTAPFPGLTAIPACVGAALLLHANADQPTRVGRLLSLRPLVFVGKISYSLYLWHWPIFVFARYVKIEPLSPIETAACVAATLVMATLSWRFVEQPFRKPATPGSDRRAIIVAAAGIGAVSLMGGALYLSQGWPQRIPPAALATLVRSQYMDPRVNECHLVYDRRAKDLCVRGAPGVAPSFLLAGDSHAGALAQTVFHAAAADGVSGYQLSDAGWTPLIGYEKWGEQKKYAYLSKLMAKTLAEHPELKTVVIINYWTQDVTLNRYYGPDGRLYPGAESIVAGMGALARRYPERTFILMGGDPRSDLFGYHTAARAMTYRRAFAPVVTRDEFSRQQARYAPALKALDALPNVTVVDPAPYLCDDRSCPGQGPEGLYYRDDNHLSQIGAERLFPMFVRFWRPGPPAG